MNPVFRPSRPADGAAVKLILEGSGLSLHSAANSGNPEPYKNPNPNVYVLDVAGVLVGVLQFRQVADEAEILDIAIASAHRRLGYARFLLISFLEVARQRAVKTVFLEVRESNIAAIRLYESAGFSTTGRRPNYYRNPDEAALLMNLKLTG